VAHGRFEFTGGGAGLFGSHFVNMLLVLVTLGLYAPWAVASNQMWLAKHTHIDGKQLAFKGTGAGFFGVCLLSALLCLVTLGLYYPWALCRVERWKVRNLYFANDGDVEKT